MKKYLFILLAFVAAAFVSCNKTDPNSLDGRWDGRLEDQDPSEKQRITLIFNGNNVDVYIVPWGDHLAGTFEYKDNKITFNFDPSKCYDALMKDEYSQGWWDGDGALNPETFELTYTEDLPYRWYQMDGQEFSTDVDFLSDFDFTITAPGKAKGSKPMPLVYTKR